MVLLRSSISPLRYDADVHDALAMIEFKYDKNVQKGDPPTLHPSDSEKPLASTFASLLPAGFQSRYKGIEQLGEYNGVTQTAQAPFKNNVIGTLITSTRMLLEYTDRGGAVLSTEHNFHEDFSVMLASVLAHKDSATDLEGLQPGITPLARKDKTPIPLSEFEINPVEVRTGNTAAISRRVVPFKVDLKLDALHGQLVEVFAFGHDLCAQAIPMSEEDARKRWSLQLSAPPPCVMDVELPSGDKPTPVGTLTREAKVRANVAIHKARQEAAFAKPPKQYAPSTLSGSATTRFKAKALHSETTGILQLSWESGRFESETNVIRRVNRLGIKVVPKLIGSADIAELDKGAVRGRLLAAFPKQMRPTGMVLKAMLFETSWTPLHAVIDIRHFLRATASIIQGMSDPLIL